METTNLNIHQYLWALPVLKFNPKLLREEYFKRHGVNLKPYFVTTHGSGYNSHALSHYQLKVMETPMIMLVWSWCWNCNEEKRRRLVTFDNNVAYVRDILNG